MFPKDEELGVDFFPKLLLLITEAFRNKDIAILECVDKNGTKVRVLATTRIDSPTRKIEFIPIATLFDANPMVELQMVNGGAVLASQIPMEKWVKEAASLPINKSTLN